MEIVLFIIISLVALVSALLVITRRNPVSSVLFLVLTFFCLAVLYVILGAEFIAALQVIVYAGAIMVLFIFVVMLLNMSGTQSWEISGAFRILLGFGAAGLILILTVPIIKGSVGTASDVNLSTIREMQDSLSTNGVLNDNQSKALAEWFAAPGIKGKFQPTSLEDSVKVAEQYYMTMGSAAEVGDNLFKRFLLPFEVVSVLLLAAIIGVVALLKRKTIPELSEQGGERQ